MLELKRTLDAEVSKILCPLCHQVSSALRHCYVAGVFSYVTNNCTCCYMPGSLHAGDAFWYWKNCFTFISHHFLYEGEKLHDTPFDYNTSMWLNYLLCFLLYVVSQLNLRLCHLSVVFVTITDLEHAVDTVPVNKLVLGITVKSKWTCHHTSSSFLPFELCSVLCMLWPCVCLCLCVCLSVHHKSEFY